MQSFAVISLNAGSPPRLCENVEAIEGSSPRTPCAAPAWHPDGILVANQNARMSATQKIVLHFQCAPEFSHSLHPNRTSELLVKKVWMESGAVSHAVRRRLIALRSKAQAIPRATTPKRSCAATLRQTFAVVAWGAADRLAIRATSLLGAVARARGGMDREGEGRRLVERLRQHAHMGAARDQLEAARHAGMAAEPFRHGARPLDRARLS